MTNSYWKLDLSFNQSIKSIFNKTNKWVGIIGSDYCRYWPKKFQDIQATNLQLIDYFNKGGLVTLMGPPNNPWTGGDQNDLTNCKKIGSA
jgi:hypothetical protein